jgi:protein-disulfide isomerase
MRRYLPFVIIGIVLLIALGTGLALFRWKQPRSAETAPLVPIVSVTPVPTVAPATSIAPAAPPASAVPAAHVPPTVPVAQESPGAPNTALPHFRGGAHAPVTIEEFGDFQCVPCGDLFPKLKKVEADYGERLRVVFRHKPMHKHEHAPLAARATEAAGLQGRFWEMHDLLFENSLRWTKGVDTIGPEASPSRRLQSPLVAMDIEVREVFVRYAEILKLDVERFKTDMDSDEVKARVEADQARAETLVIDRTPTLYINGHLMPAPSHRNVDTLHAAIDAELNGKKPGEAASVPTATPGQSK